MINPITRLDYPDPDIIRVGDTYYMVSTTMYFMPGCEILRSYDLVNWEHAAYVYERLDSTPAQRLEGKENIYGQGMWAASLRYHEGTFYICFVANDTHKTYLYTSPAIEGPWEKSFIPGFYHDNSILFDEDGRIYIVYGNRQIYITELCMAKELSNKPGPSAEGEGNILRPKEGGLNELILKDCDDAPLGYEGSHIYKIKGRYYLFVIGIPKDSGKRTESCFVADKPQGPYFGCKVMDDDRSYRGSGVAQGGIVQSSKGSWYSILFQDSGAVGRIPILMPVTWKETDLDSLRAGIAGADGKELSEAPAKETVSFPVFGDNGVIPETFEIEDLKPGHRYTPLVSGDDFKNTTDAKYDSFGLKSCWQFNHEPDLSLFEHDKKSGRITITTGKLSTNPVQAKNVLTQRALFPGFKSSVILDATGINDGDYAGLGILESHYCFIAVTKRDGRYCLTMGTKEITTGGFWGERNDDEPFDERECIPLDSPVVRLYTSVCFDNRQAQSNMPDDTAGFYYSPFVTGEGKVPVNTPIPFGVDHKLFFKLDHFTGARIALFIYSTQSIGGSAVFSDFQYK